MSRLHLALVCGVALGLACSSEPIVNPSLDDSERRLVDAYVRLSILEALRPDYADSVDAVLDSLAAAWDSTAILTSIDAMQEHPFRWEKVYMAISAELTYLQRSPDSYWAAVYDPELHAPEPTPAPGLVSESTPEPSSPASTSSESTRESDR